MSGGVDIPLATMAELNSALKAIVLEFEDAGGHTDALLEAIGRPFSRRELGEQARDFESRWDDKRETLRGHLVSLQEQVEGVRDGWAQFDSDLAAELEAAGE